MTTMTERTVYATTESPIVSVSAGVARCSLGTVPVPTSFARTLASIGTPHRCATELITICHCFSLGMA